MGSTCSLLARLWRSLQVETHGGYSSQRVLELAKYRNEASWLRVITILFITPLPCLLVPVFVDLLPLANPFQGIHANKMFYVRLFYTFLVDTFLATCQFRISVPALSYPLARVIRNTVVVSVIGVGVSYGLAASVGFPLPFSAMIIAPSWVSLVLVSLAIEWGKQIKGTPGAGTMVINAFKLWMCEASLVFTYPVYYYTFTTLPRRGKTAFTLLLPVLKILMKNIIARSVVHLKDEMPEVVVLNVDVFNNLFLCYCMHNSPSLWVTLEIILFDVLMMAFSLNDARNEHRNLLDIERRIEQERGWNSFITRGGLSSGRATKRLTTLDRASMILQNTRLTTSSSGLDISPVSRRLSAAPSVVELKPSVEAASRSMKSIAPIGKVRVHPAASSDGRAPIRYARKVQRLVYVAEFLLLLNYVEVVIPLIYSMYLYAMYHLPNRDYYIQLRGVDQDHLRLMLNNVLFYCSLQLVSLLMLLFALRYFVGLAPIHQLAYVLERQFRGVQLKFVFWVYYNVHASLQHSGYDYSLKFNWMHH